MKGAAAGRSPRSPPDPSTLPGAPRLAGHWAAARPAASDRPWRNRTERENAVSGRIHALAATTARPARLSRRGDLPASATARNRMISPCRLNMAPRLPRSRRGGEYRISMKGPAAIACGHTRACRAPSAATAQASHPGSQPKTRPAFRAPEHGACNTAPDRKPCLCLICQPGRSDPVRARLTYRISSFLRSIRRNGRGRPSSCRKRSNSNSRPQLASRDLIIGFSSFPGDLPIPIPDRRNTRLRIYATPSPQGPWPLAKGCR